MNPVFYEKIETIYFSEKGILFRFLLSKMSFKWRYDSDDFSGEILSIYSIQETVYGQSNPVYKWYVRLNTGETRGVYSLTLQEFNGKDRDALQTAFKNIEKMKLTTNTGTIGNTGNTGKVSKNSK